VLSPSNSYCPKYFYVSSKILNVKSIGFCIPNGNLKAEVGSSYLLVLAA
jgi:hypothetical protein